ncbi:MAG: hypothetical protein KVP17_002426 [Porospora cf. gigantea B]|uniref:uncharacterized protein n=1 Tax=Porospora cf. gigantea B TaxID=2853592 RepID=UPI003571E81B|nr:MAG: hypothetical protein KVP17_002426 [Porospora cf. gigantea B]
MNFEMFDPAIVRQNLGSSNPFTSSRRVRFGVEIRISSSKVTNFNIGAISVRKEVTSQIRQPDLQRRQDASFLWEALNQGKTLLAIPAELSAYTKPMSSKRRDVLAPMLDSSIIQTK